jgi:hemolysin activation/secretion protein
MKLQLSNTGKQIVLCFILLCLISFFCFTMPAPGRSDEPTNEDNMLSGLATIKVKTFNLKGNTAFSDQELSQITVPYENRQISIEELETVRNRLTRYYTDRGYINSGAVIPDQNVENGIITISIIEGKIIDTKISGNDWLHTRYIKGRLKSAIGKEEDPFNIRVLEERLKLLKQNKLIKNINANIKPGFKQGEANLSVAIEEESPYNLTLRYDNHASSGIGTSQRTVSFVHDNVTGWGDSVSAKYKKTKGYDNISFDYTLPVTRWDTSLFFNYSESGATVVLYPFDMLDIESKTKTIGFGIKHPFYKTLSQKFIAGLKLEKKHSETFLLGVPFSFGTHPDDFEIEVTTFTFSQEYVAKDMSQVFAMNSDIKFGMDCLGASVYEGKDRTGNDYADSEYIVWLLQMQWFKRLSFVNSSLLFKTNFQISDRPLLSLEKFSIGGVSNVRGYRENFMTRDNSLVTTLEWRFPLFKLQIPVLSKAETDGGIELSPFFDYGMGWNTQGDNSNPKDISSIGAGLGWHINNNIYMQIYYGYALRDIEKSGENNLQDKGIHFEISVNLF